MDWNQVLHDEDTFLETSVPLAGVARSEEDMIFVIVSGLELIWSGFESLSHPLPQEEVLKLDFIYAAKRRGKEWDTVAVQMIPSGTQGSFERAFWRIDRIAESWISMGEEKLEELGMDPWFVHTRFKEYLQRFWLCPRLYLTPDEKELWVVCPVLKCIHVLSTDLSRWLPYPNSTK